MPKKYVVARLDEKLLGEPEPLFFIYMENRKGVDVIARSPTPGLLAFDFMFDELKEQNSRDYSGSFSLSYNPTIDVYVSPNSCGDQPNHSPSKIYDVNKMTPEERKIFEDELLLRLGLRNF
ncbi:MAG: hypothetical protein AABW48_00555 [Nanoarchaeota archaeon]